MAQYELWESHQLETGAVPFDKLPSNLQQEWQGKPKEQGLLKLGLQEAYRLLRELDPPPNLGSRFQELQLDSKERSPLSTRNQSILAHGFQPIGDKSHVKLRDAVLSLLGVETQSLPRFPRLPMSL